nr:carcinoembryonic antigen-related cell adhesion molecule 8-like [Macaca nemestrina]
MGSPSAPLHRWCIPWQTLLLTASLLTFWNPPTTAQLTIESRPFNVAEGKEVLLLAHNVSQNLFGYIWYKGERVDASRRIGSCVIRTQQITPGPAHSGRETIDFNASLLIHNVTQSDTGSYTIQVIKEDLVNEEATGQFRVYPELPKPYISSNNSNPVEDKDAVTLTCEPETQDTTYLWWVNNQSLPVSPRLELSSDNRTLTVFNIPRNDTTSYKCETQNPVSVRRSDPVTLNVLYGPDAPPFPGIKGATQGNLLSVIFTAELPKPYITSNNSNPIEDKDAVTLTCEPETQDTTYRWWVNNQSLSVSSRLELSNDNRTLTLFNIPRNDTTFYECETQNPVSVRRSDPVTLNVLCEYLCSSLAQGNLLSVIFTAELPKPYITSNNSNPIEDKDAVTLTCEPVAENTTYLWWVNNQSLSVSPRLQLSNDNRILTLLSVTRNDTGPYECGIQNSESAKRSDPVTLNVTYGPDTPIISPPDLSYRSGANLNLSCHSDSNPSPQYSWLINGTLRQHTQVLFISKITSNNNGAYACFVSNLATGRNNSIVKNISVSSGDSAPGSSGLSARATVGIIIGMLVGVALM